MAVTLRIETSNGEFCTLTIDPKTLITVDDDGENIVLFPEYKDRGHESLRNVIEAACQDDTACPKRAWEEVSL